MAAKSGGGDDIVSDINIVPLVDIILVVLIIFIVSASTMATSRMDVSLPEAGSGQSGEPSLLTIGVTPEGRITVGGSETDEARLRAVAEFEVSRDPEVQAVIAADRATPHGVVVSVMDTVKSAGVKKLAVSVDAGGI